jgi:KipI family sensor histidine kinase inhibitor
MIYPEPRYLPGGDRYILVEFGNEMNLELNFMAQGLAAAIAEARITGVIETAPCFASMLVHYEPELIGFDDLVVELGRLVAGLGPSDALELDSRLWYLPAVYLDPWTRACVEDYIAKIAPKTPDPELMVELNGLRDVDDFVRVHSGTEYWVASLGFWPGLPFMMALDPRAKMTAPKYNPPRTWTPGGAIGLGGASTAIYPEALPGGYQIFARTPVPIWDRTQRFSAFEGSICLFRPGDRVRFVPCTVAEFEAIEREVADGTYQYNMVGYGKFSVALYKSWTASLGAGRGS